MILKMPTSRQIEQQREKMIDSYRRQYSKISPLHAIYIDGMIEGFIKGTQWMIDNNK